MTIKSKCLSSFNKWFCETSNPEVTVLLIATFIVYVFSTLLIGVTHEQWFDEAQAWLLARELSPWELIVNHIRYEGSPPLWHLVLSIPAKLGFPFENIFIISTLFSSIGVGLLLFKTNTPIGFKLLLPFSFYIFFQYSVVSRSYCLIFPILVLISIFHKHKKKQPTPYWMSIVILSWVSIHCSLFAGAIVVIELFQHLKQKQNGKYRNRHLYIFTLVFALNTIAILLICYPPKDLTFQGFYSRTAECFATPAIGYIRFGLMGETLFSVTLLVTFLAAISKTHSARYFLVPYILLAIVSGFVHWNYWHSGVLFCLLIFSLLVNSNKVKTWPQTVSIALLIVCLIQIKWSINSAVFDINHSYSGARKAAVHLRPYVDSGKSIDAIGFTSHAVFAYFPKGKFKFNNAGIKAHEFYSWKPDAIPRKVTSLSSEADVLLVSIMNVIDIEKVPTPDGYRKSLVAPGFIYWQTDIVENYVYIIFEKIS